MRKKKKELRKYLQEMLTARTGGYKEVPEELILEQARRVGVEASDIPKVRVEEDIEGAYLDWSSEDEPTIVVPRREPKWEVPGTLRHELIHYKQGVRTYGDVDTWEEVAKLELEGEEGKRGKKTNENLISVAASLTLDEDFSSKKAFRLVENAARELGYSNRVINNAKKWWKDYWKRIAERNYL